MNKRILCLAATLSTLLLAQPPGGGPPGGGGQGDGIWRRNAYYGEVQTFDSCVGHQPGTGDYHYHANPLCLRAQLNDNLITVKNSRVGAVYQEGSGPFQHSPILGWMFDGYPIYGPYGYSSATDATSDVKRLASGFRLRAITERSSLPDWAMPNHSGVAQTLTSAQYGPPINTTYPLGRYNEDFEWAAGVGDLDQYNGRFEVTPEFPNGTYAYHVTIDENGDPAYPYLIGGQYYGTVTGGAARTIPSGVTVANAQTPSPYLASWATSNATQMAQVVSGYDPSAGPSTIWPTNVPSTARYSGGATAATFADIQQVRYSDTAVYVNASGFSSATMGPWFDPTMTGGVFSNFPSNQNTQAQIPRAPAAAASKTSTGMGAIGIWVNGVNIYNFLDGGSYSNSTGKDAGGGTVTPTTRNYSAVSGEQGPVAPGSLVKSVSLFGAVLSATTETMPELATSLGGTTVMVKDAAGMSRTAAISMASPTELTYVIPSGTAAGFGTVTFTVGASSVTTNINVLESYPNLYSADAVAPTFGTADDGTATLTMAGSGLGNATDWSATIAGVAATGVSASTSAAGVDQYVIALPAAVVGQGVLNVVVTVAGRKSNTVSVVF